MRRLGLAALALAGLLAGAGGTAAADLQPYQMMRSLQLVQDRIAEGDHAALPMQRKLLELVDQRLLDADPSVFDDRRNFRALLVYAMSGGNPKTVEILLSRLKLEDAEKRLGYGIVSYLKGEFAKARMLLAGADPRRQPPGLGAFVGLVKGAVTTREDPAAALRLFDLARLMAPGTLVEEAALRRSVSLAATLGDGERFARASGQYVRRFLRSPYASQFAEAFVAAIVALDGKIELATVDAVVSGMSEEQAGVIYLRLARKSAIDGYDALLDFASARAAEHARRNGVEDDPRATLYASIASVTSQNVVAVLETLEGIDRRRLSAADRRLLDAAIGIAREVLSAPAAQEPAAAAAADDGAAREAPARPVAAGAAADAASAAQGEAAMKTPAMPPDLPPAVADTQRFVSDARNRLEEIDALIEENKP